VLQLPAGVRQCLQLLELALGTQILEAGHKHLVGRQQVAADALADQVEKVQLVFDFKKFLKL